MSGAKSFGVREPPDPPKLRGPLAPSPATDSSTSSPSDGGAACADNASATCHCDTHGEPQAPPRVAEVVPPQLLKPFPEPALPERPSSGRTPASRQTLGGIAASFAVRDPGEAFLIHDTPKVVWSQCVPDPNVQSSAHLNEASQAKEDCVPCVVDQHPQERDAESSSQDEPSCSSKVYSGPDRRPNYTQSCRPSGKMSMYSFDENDDVHPYIKILDTPAPPRPLLAQYLQPLCWSLIGFGSGFAHNLFASKPMFAGIQRHLGLAAGGWVLGVYLQKWVSTDMSETDAVLKHYIQLHPEDFPVPERKPYAEVLQPWRPMR